MKNIIFGLIIAAIVGGGIFYYINSTKKSSDVTPPSISSQSLVSPVRLAEINGYITSIQGNEITIANEIGVKEVTAEERARRQKLTQEERQALKAQESANLTKESVDITIPVGITIVKGSGAADGTNVKAEMSELAKGVYVSIWKTGNSVEFVKLKGVSTQ
ncbi:MAG: hypothetical protein WA061_03505 [Microgenomates group bacterium]